MTLSNTKQTKCVTLASCDKLLTSEENWRVLAEMLPQLVWTTQANGWVDYANQRFCVYTHATPEQLQGYGWSQFLHPEDSERALAVRADALQTGVPYEVEYRLREGQTGNYRWFLVRGMPVRDDAGQIVRWFGTCTDIEEQKCTEHALRQSQERSRTLSRVKMTTPDQAPLFECVIREVTTRGQHTPIEAEVVCQDGGRLPIVCEGSSSRISRAR